MLQSKEQQNQKQIRRAEKTIDLEIGFKYRLFRCMSVSPYNKYCIFNTLKQKVMTNTTSYTLPARFKQIVAKFGDTPVSFFGGRKAIHLYRINQRLKH